MNPVSLMFCRKYRHRPPWLCCRSSSKPSPSLSNLLPKWPSGNPLSTWQKTAPLYPSEFPSISTMLKLRKISLIMVEKNTFYFIYFTLFKVSYNFYNAKTKKNFLNDVRKKKHIFLCF